MPDGEGETIKLFELEGEALTALPALDTVDEQLITPRFTEEGQMYVLKVAD